jgi:uncharacterized protein
MSSKIFLSATWEYLAMFNYEVDPEVLKPHLPPFTEIDYFEGKAIVSVVGFLFNNTKVMGVKWPGFVNFEEVNLRYYIKYFDGKEWKRGVGFISEIVPSKIIATTANVLYNEHYSTAKMSHILNVENNKLSIEYFWQKRNGYKNVMQISASAFAQKIEPNSEAEFIFEHYYGYNKFNETTTIEYSLAHPIWEVYPVISHILDYNVEELYGAEFVPFLQNVNPLSVMLAKGSAVNVKTPKKLKQ